MRNLAILGIVLALTACGGVKDTLGFAKAPPDEFMVIGRPPLSMPPDFNLPAPMIKSGKSGAPETATDTRLYSTYSAAEAALLDKTGAAEADPEVRTTLEQQTLVEAATKEEPGFWDDIFFWGKNDGETTIDPVEEKEKLEKQKSADTTKDQSEEKKDDAALKSSSESSDDKDSSEKSAAPSAP